MNDCAEIIPSGNDELRNPADINTAVSSGALADELVFALKLAAEPTEDGRGRAWQMGVGTLCPGDNRCAMIGRGSLLSISYGGSEPVVIQAYEHGQPQAVGGVFAPEESPVYVISGKFPEQLRITDVNNPDVGMIIVPIR